MWIWILLAVLGLFASLAFLAVRIEIEYNDSLRVVLRIGGVPMLLYPAKKKKLRLSDYDIKKLKRKRKKKSAKKAKKPSPKAKSEKQDIAGAIELIINIVYRIIKKTRGYLRVDLDRLYISVGAEDAAKTAVLYGVVSQLASYLLELLKSAAEFHLEAENVFVGADFISGKTDAEIAVRLRLRVWQVLSLLISAGFAFVEHNLKSAR